jgi:arginase
MSLVKKTIEIIGVPCDLGANIRGATMGPAAIRVAEVKAKIESLGYPVTDSGDIDVMGRDQVPEIQSSQNFLPAIAALNEKLFLKALKAHQRNHLPVVLGGDHSIAIGSISASSKYFADQNQKAGLLWIDAHADVNTPASSPSGNIHGMPLAVIMGQGHESLTQIGGSHPKIDPKNIALVGIRDIDDSEKKELKKAGIRYFTMREIDERGKHEVMQEAMTIVSHETAGIHLSCDIDGVDPMYAPGVSTPVVGGLSFREIHLALEMLADSGKLCAIDMVELNPFYDRQNQTAKLAVGLIQSALGKSIV